MTKKEFRILSNKELETQVQTLKEYYGVKSKAGAIKKAIRDCATVAEHTNVICGVDYGTKDGDKGCTVKGKEVNRKVFIDSIEYHDGEYICEKCNKEISGTCCVHCGYFRSEGKFISELRGE